MKVKEPINELKRLPPNVEVVQRIDWPGNCEDDRDHIEIGTHCSEVSHV